MCAGLSGYGIMAANAAGELLAKHVTGAPLPEAYAAYRTTHGPELTLGSVLWRYGTRRTRRASCPSGGRAKSTGAAWRAAPSARASRSEAEGDRRALFFLLT